MYRRSPRISTYTDPASPPASPPPSGRADLHQRPHVCLRRAIAVLEEALDLERRVDEPCQRGASRRRPGESRAARPIPQPADDSGDAAKLRTASISLSKFSRTVRSRVIDSTVRVRDWRFSSLRAPPRRFSVMYFQTSMPTPALSM